MMTNWKSYVMLQNVLSSEFSDYTVEYINVKVEIEKNTPCLHFPS